MARSVPPLRATTAFADLGVQTVMAQHRPKHDEQSYTKRRVNREVRDTLLDKFDTQR